MSSKTIVLSTLLVVLMTYHLSYGDYGCGNPGDQCNYECFSYCVRSDYGSGGCRGSKCVCSWTVINETQNSPQNQNPGNYPNNPNNQGNFNPNNPNSQGNFNPNNPRQLTGQPYNQYGVTPSYLNDEENRTRHVTERPESGRRESDEKDMDRKEDRREERYGD